MPGGYVAEAFPGFGGGLNLRDKVDVVEPNQAIDLLNVTFTDLGGVAQRDGYQKFTAAELTNQGDSLHPFYKTDGTSQLIVGNGNKLTALGTNGAVVASTTSPTASQHHFARFGTPSAEYLYAGNGTDTLFRWTGSAWSQPTATVDGTSGRAMPKAKFLAVDAESNRLVAANTPSTGGPHGASSGSSHVWFSEEGAPETWLTTQYIQLTPGDGEQIMGMVSFRSYVIVFKETKFFVFYGETTDTAGNTAFTYRTIDVGVGLAAPKALCVGRDGVYFLDRSGIYMTDGSEVSIPGDLIDPVFHGSASTYFKSSTLNRAQVSKAAMGWFDEKIFVAIPTGSSTTNDRVLVHDPRYGWWSLFDFPASALGRFRIGSRDELVFTYATGDNHVGRWYQGNGFLTDDLDTDGTGGVAVTARWRSGWFDYGSSEVKTIRESKLWGTGKVTVSITRDFQDTGGQSQTVTLTASGDVWSDGTDPDDLWGDGTTDDLWRGGAASQSVPRLVRMATRGAAFSTELKNSTLNRQFGVQRLSHHLREQRIPSTVKTEAA